MLNSKTVFILGAGASCEFGFPLGSRLKEIISSKLYFDFNNVGHPPLGDQRISDRLRFKYRDFFDEFIRICHKISKGVLGSDSIDDFINQHNSDERIVICGKLAIACSILDAEKDSKLYFDQDNVNATIDYNAIKNT